MKLTKNEIEYLKETANSTKRSLKQSDTRYDRLVDATIRSARANFNYKTMDTEVDYLNGRHTVAFAKNEDDAKCGKDDMEEAALNWRNAKLTYKAQLAAIYMETKALNEMRDDFMWVLRHPVQAYRLHKAMNLIERELKDAGMTKKEAEGYGELANEETPIPQSAEVGKDGLSIKIDDAAAREEISLDLDEEPQNDFVPFAEDTQELATSLVM